MSTHLGRIPGALRTLTKGPEPDVLPRCRAEAERIVRESGRPLASEDWSILRDPDPVREALVRDQQALCAYCLRRIKPTGYRKSNPEGMKIEHFRDRSTHPAEMFDWTNLLGVCSGITYYGGVSVSHCDDSRGKKPLFTYPHDPTHQDPDDPTCKTPYDLTPPTIIDFFDWELPSMRIIPKITRDEDPVAYQQLQADINTLNLNAPHLIEDRKQVREQLRRHLRKLDKDRTGTRPSDLARLHRDATTPSPKGHLPPYAPLRRALLERRMRQAGMNIPA